MQSNPWFPPVQGRTPRARLFCFPAAGKGAAVYMTWRQHLGSTVEVLPVRLPGRESRFREEPITHFARLIELLANHIEPLFDVPCAFFGHSLGALIAFELTRLLRKRGAAVPTHLCVAGRPAPHLPRPAPIYHLPSRAFLSAIQDRYGAFDDEFRRNPMLIQQFEPILRGDFTLFDTYQYCEDVPLDCHIVAWGGLHDSSTSEIELQSWERHTSRSFSCRFFKGGHFFFEKDETVRKLLLNDVSSILAASVGPDAESIRGDRSFFPR